MISSAFAEALESNRERYNSLFSQARREAPALDGGEFLHLLATRVDPLIARINESTPETAQAAADALYTATLTLYRKGLIGSQDRYPDYESQLFRLLQAAESLLGIACSAVVGAAANGLYNLTRSSGCRPGEWVERLCDVADRCDDVSLFRTVGQVAAWTCGMAQYREPALALARSLPEEMLAGLFRVSNGRERGSALLDRLSGDPWYRPDAEAAAAEPRIVAEAGGFRGTGGIFLGPPEVFASDGVFYVTDRTGCWMLFADAFGAAFRRVRSIPDSRSRGPYRVTKTGIVHGPHSKAKIGLLRGSSSHASTDTTLAVTLPHSHQVFLVSEVSP